MSDKFQFQKTVSVLMIFILMAELPGCVTSSQFIEVNSIPLHDVTPATNAYVIYGLRSSHFPKYKAYIIRDIEFSNGYLTAERDRGSNKPWTYFKIYVRADSLIRVAPDNSLKVAITDIDKVQVEDINWYLFWGYAAVGIVLSSLILYWILGDPNNGNQI
jgi:hypothetical protein